MSFWTKNRWNIIGGSLSGALSGLVGGGPSGSAGRAVSGGVETGSNRAGRAAFDQEVAKLLARDAATRRANGGTAAAFSWKTDPTLDSNLVRAYLAAGSAGVRSITQGADGPSNYRRPAPAPTAPFFETVATSASARQELYR
jgi:hypothetical protein